MSGATLHLGTVEEGEDRTLIVRPRSYVERLDLGLLFPKAQLLEVELGSGDGSFLARYASLHPERNFLGVERLLGRLRKLDRKGLRAGLENLRLIRIEASYLLEYLLPAHAASAMHVYFPDPWPKRRHRKNRLINEQFPELAWRALAKSGRVFLRTDDRDYYEQMRSVFTASPRFREMAAPEELIAVVTDFERAFLAKGIGGLRASYERAD